MSSGWTETDANNTTLKGSASNDRFGMDVALSSSGQRLAVAIQRTNTGRGSVEVYDLSSDTWSAVGSSFPSSSDLDENARLSAIAMSANGTRIVYGAHRHQSSSNTANGKIAVFDWNGSNWTEVDSIVSTYEFHDVRENLGESIAMSEDGSKLVVSARNYSETGSNDAKKGRILFYEVSGGSLQSFAQSDGIAGNNEYENFGECVDMSADGSYVIASTRANDSNHTDSKGRTRIYKYNGTNYIRKIEIQGSAGDGLGVRCGINGDGDLAFTVSRDSAYIKIYERGGDNGETWTERSDTWPTSESWTDTSTDTIRDVKMNSDGTVIAIASTTSLVVNKTFVYQYNSSNTTWELVDEKIEPFSGNFNFYGNSVALSSTGEYVGVGVPGAQVDSTNNVGRAFVYQNDSLGSGGEGGGEGEGGGGGNPFIMVKGGFFQVAGDGSILVQ